jgi:hypothetical protein
MCGAGGIIVGHQKGRVAARAIALIACLPVIAGTCIALKWGCQLLDVDRRQFAFEPGTEAC